MRCRPFTLRALALVATLGSGGLAKAVEGQASSAEAVVDARGPARLRELFVAGEGALKAPTSPRFSALRDPSQRGTRLLVGWILPGLSNDEKVELGAVATRLGQNGDGRLRARLAPLGPTVTVEVSLETFHEVPLLSFVLTSSREGAAKELETGLLETLSSLAAEEGSACGPIVRRHLRPLARAVVEVYAPERQVAVRIVKPVRHVIERGDTLSEIAASHGLDLDALVRLNGVDPQKPIHPGEELKLSPGNAPRPKLYVAKQGDTLAKVAKHFGVSEQALVDANRIDVRRLSSGQKLVLPRQ
jgi:LysM repeat protein